MKKKLGGTMKQGTMDAIRGRVRESYAKVAKAEQLGCCGSSTSGSSCCGSPDAGKASTEIGYSAAEVGAVPEGANLGLGCGNPQAIAGLKKGEVVLDLGSGAGFDAFLAAKQVGKKGKVLGVDMTPDMVSKARSNAEKGGYKNVEFRLGEIEALPVANSSVDCVISNCVINLSPDKARVFQEAYRVLKPGGRVAVSDVVAFAPIPEKAKKDMDLYCGCIAGASKVKEVETFLRSAGFKKIRVSPKDSSKSFINEWAPGKNVADYVVSASIEAVKPFSRVN